MVGTAAVAGWSRNKTLYYEINRHSRASDGRDVGGDRTAVNRVVQVPLHRFHVVADNKQHVRILTGTGPQVRPEPNVANVRDLFLHGEETPFSLVHLGFGCGGQQIEEHHVVDHRRAGVKVSSKR